MKEFFAYFFGAGDASSMPEAEISREDLRDGSADIITLMVKAGLVPSRSEGRRAIEQGGVTANGEKVAAIALSFTAEQLKEGVVIRRGKKSFKKVVLK